MVPQLQPKNRATDMFLQFTGVGGLVGQATMPGGAKGLPIQNFHINLKMPMTRNPHASAVPSGRCVFGDLTITRYIDETSPQFQFFCANGTRIPSIVLSLAAQSGAGGLYTVFQTYKIETAFISRVSVGSSGSKEGKSGPEDAVPTDLPLEVISFSYSKITWTFTPPTNKGSASSSGKISNQWDLMSNIGG